MNIINECIAFISFLLGFMVFNEFVKVGLCKLAINKFVNCSMGWSSGSLGGSKSDFSVR